MASTAYNANTARHTAAVPVPNASAEFCNACHKPAKPAVEAGHYGLLGLRERIEGLAGTLSVHTAAGVTVEASVPLP